MTFAAREEAGAARARQAAQHEPDAGDRIDAAAAAERHEARAEAVRERGRDTCASAERRPATADELPARGLDPALVGTKAAADVSQGTPATDAGKDTGGRAAPRGPGAGEALVGPWRRGAATSASEQRRGAHPNGCGPVKYPGSAPRLQEALSSRTPSDTNVMSHNT